MDRITEKLLEEFKLTQGLGSLGESDAFEHFANYSVLFSELSETIDLDEVFVSEDSNIGVDGLAIIVNGAHVTSEQDVDSLVDANGFLDVDFVFVQAKTSPNFDLGEIGKFFFAVSDFFAEPPKLSHNESVRTLIKVKDHIYGRSGDMSKRNPNLLTFYVCTGKWTNDPTLVTRIESGITEFKQSQLFNDVKFTPVDASKLQALYRATKSKASAKLNFQWRVALPQQVHGVSEAHFGLVTATEFLGLIVDDNGNIKKSLFYDNVRDFQDYNEVNRDIKGTLTSPDKALFPLLNNGVTIIATSIRPTGNVFHIEDYQIVNGCQTSHVLFHEAKQLSDNVFVPIKIISTADDLVVNKIIKATNFQTEVKPDQLYALSEFQKTLEEYYSTFDGEQRLYYERRSKQYASSSQVEKVRIVTIQQQIRAFVSMFLGEPHRGHYPRSLSGNVGKTLFSRSHNPDPYFASAFAQYRLEYFFRNRSIDKRFKPARYHLLMAAARILQPEPIPNASANQVKGYCSRLLQQLTDDNKMVNAFKKASTIVDAARGKSELDRKLTKTLPFTRAFVKALDRKAPIKPSVKNKAPR
jgi:AIPR protein